MANIRNDAEKIIEAHRQADIILRTLPKPISNYGGNASGDAQYAIANAILDIWQVDYDLDINTLAKRGVLRNAPITDSATLEELKSNLGDRSL